MITLVCIVYYGLMLTPVIMLGVVVFVGLTRGR